MPHGNQLDKNCPLITESEYSLINLLIASPLITLQCPYVWKKSNRVIAKNFDLVSLWCMYNLL